MDSTGKFVSPFKIALLVLIKEYLSQQYVHEPSFHQLSLFLISEIKSFGLALTVEAQKKDEEERNLADLCKLLLTHLQAWKTKYTLVDALYRQLQGLSECPNDLFDFFADLSKMFPSTQEEEEEEIMSDPPSLQLDPSSFFGLFVRKNALAFSSLSFDGISQLFKNMQLYLQEYYQYQSQQNRGNTRQINARKRLDILEEGEDDDAMQLGSPLKNTSTNNGNGHEDEGEDSTDNSFAMDLEEVDQKVTQEANRLKGSSSFFVSPQLIDKLKEVALMRPISKQARIEYLRFLSSLNRRDFQTCLDHLHRYFDYNTQLFSGFAPSVALPSHLNVFGSTHNPNDNNNNNGESNNNDPIQLELQRILLPYCVLNLAILHFHFGHFEEAMQAIQETVRIAQERNNQECLVYTLSWLYQLNHSSPLPEIMAARHNSSSSNESNKNHKTKTKTSNNTSNNKSNHATNSVDILLRSIHRSKELHMSHVHALSYLHMAQDSMRHHHHHHHTNHTHPNYLAPLSSSSTNGPQQPLQGPSPQFVTELLNQSLRSNYSSSIGDPVVGTSQQPSPASLLVPTAAVYQDPDASALGMLGKGHAVVSGVWERYGQHDMANVHLQLVLEQYQRHSSDPVVGFAQCQLASQFAERGQVEDAIRLLCSSYNDYYGPSQDPSFHNLWMHRSASILFQTFLPRTPRQKGGDALLLLEVLNHHVMQSLPTVDVDPAVALDVLYHQTLLWIHKGYLQKAFYLLHHLIHNFQKRTKSLQLQKIPYLLTLAEIYLLAGNPLAALRHVLSCLSLTEYYNLNTVHAMATVLLADIRYQLGDYHKCITLIESVQSELMQQRGSLLLRGNISLLLAKSWLATHSRAGPDDASLLEQKVIPLLSASERDYRLAAGSSKGTTAADRLAEVCYLLARVCHQVGDTTARDSWAKKFRLITTTTTPTITTTTSTTTTTATSPTTTTTATHHSHKKPSEALRTISLVYQLNADTLHSLLQVC